MSENNTTNAVQRFLFKELNIRGQHVHLQESWQEMLKDRHYPECIVKLLGELTAMAVFMANGIKHTGRITMQVQGSGPISLLVVDVTHDLKLRGVAKTNKDITTEMSIDELLGDGQILMTLENTQTQHHFHQSLYLNYNLICSCFEQFLCQLTLH